MGLLIKCVFWLCLASAVEEAGLAVGCQEELKKVKQNNVELSTGICRCAPRALNEAMPGTRSGKEIADQR